MIHLEQIDSVLLQPRIDRTDAYIRETSNRNPDDTHRAVKFSSAARGLLQDLLNGSKTVDQLLYEMHIQ